MVAKEHRPISFLEWQKKTKHGDERADPLREGTARSSRHQDSSPRRREPEGSRHPEASRARSREDRHRRDPQARPSRDSPRPRAPSPERRRPASRPRVDERHVMIVPKYVDINHGIDRLELLATACFDTAALPYIAAQANYEKSHLLQYSCQRQQRSAQVAQYILYLLPLHFCTICHLTSTWSIKPLTAQRICSVVITASITPCHVTTTAPMQLYRHELGNHQGVALLLCLFIHPFIIFLQATKARQNSTRCP